MASKREAAIDETAQARDSGQSRDMADGYKWIALSNTTLGVLMATINTSILLISLPAIFRSIGINPLAPGETSYLLWLLLGYMIVTATLLVSFGRLSDMVGRVKMYNLGFAVFTVASILLFLTPGSGNAAALLLILFRLVQGVGAALLFANSTAILVDAFPQHQRGLALGINGIAAVAGSLGGLLLGGVLAAINWRLVFLVSVPFGLFGTVWAYLKLKENATLQSDRHIDIPGNITFGLGLTLVLVGLTYGIMPYGSSSMGWTNSFVVGCLVAGIVLLALFFLIERRASDPMFNLSLFAIRPFSAGNVSLLMGSMARGGLQFMLVIWLQGIWLPLHGYSFDSTPLWSGIYTMPLLLGFLILGPVAGALSDRIGTRPFTVGGMALATVGFLGLTVLPGDFNLWAFFGVLVILGIGLGIFSAPNTTEIMNAVPPQQRGAASGMRTTFQNGGMLLSMSLFFTVVIVGLAGTLPGVLYSGLVHEGITPATARHVAALPPTAALFSAFLGYNPLGSLLPHPVLVHLSATTRATVVGTHFFPTLIMPAFMSGLRAAFYAAAVLTAIAAVISWLGGATRRVWILPSERAESGRAHDAMAG